MDAHAEFFLPHFGHWIIFAMRPILKTGFPLANVVNGKDSGPTAFSGHHAGERFHLAPPFPAIIERLVRTVVTGHITPAQAIAVHGNDADPTLAARQRVTRLSALA